MPAKKPIRRTQLISPWGVGQMINFPKDESLMVAGLDLWEEKFRALPEPDEFKITEERLARRLGVKDFRLPPDYRDPAPGIVNPSLRIPFVRFPRWHYCARCGHMEKVSIYSSRKPTCPGFYFAKGRSCSEIPPTKRQQLIPVRFISICPHGHIQDFPFKEWVHGYDIIDDNHKLRLRAGRSSGALTGIEITCSCGASRSLAGAFNEDAVFKITGITCSGDRPWLGEESERKNTQHCGQHLMVVQKGASNVYFSQVRSSIYLPQWENSVDRRLVEVLEKNWAFLSQGRENGSFQRMRFELVAERNFALEKIEYYTDKLLEAAEKRLAGNDSFDIGDSEEKYRKMEYDAILSQAGGENQDFYVTKNDASVYEDSEGEISMTDCFSSISLLHKLRETRALIGFSRILPDDGKDMNAKKAFLKLGQSINWLPAIVVKGEGVFFEFNDRKLKKWAAKEAVKERVKLLSNKFNQSRISKGKPERRITPEFVLIHTFAHLLINQFSYECGYGSSSLRERVYCNLDSEDIRMNGVLVYTASGDAEGSLGGLVRMGRPGNLQSVIFNAIENARWCSSDPICIDSSGQGPNSCNLAACHNCALLPETCCEQSNMLLDRGLVIGTLDNNEIGYFSL